MLELLAIGAGSFTVALSGALMPGPLFTITITETVRRGFRAGPLLMTGHAVLELAVVVAVVMGLGPFLKKPTVMGTIALFGGGFLLFMGTDMLRSAARLTLSLNADGTSVASGRNPRPRGVGEPVESLLDPMVGHHRFGIPCGCHESGPVGCRVFFHRAHQRRFRLVLPGLPRRHEGHALHGGSQLPVGSAFLWCLPDGLWRVVSLVSKGLLVTGPDLESGPGEHEDMRASAPSAKHPLDPETHGKNLDHPHESDALGSWFPKPHRVMQLFKQLLSNSSSPVAL